MCAPTRYTTRHRSVKRIFSFSSGTLNRLGSLGAVTAQLAMVPPACSIFERAEADTVTPFTLNLRCTSPMPSSLMGRSGRRTSPAPNSVSGVTSAPSASWPRCLTLTTCAGCLNGFVKPRFGMRRMSGICPPSKPGRVWPPERAVWPFPPRPAVLPIPEPGPRPLRMRARCEPTGGRRPCSTTRCAVIGFALARGLACGFAFVRPPSPLRPPRPVVFDFRLIGAIRLLPFLRGRHHDEVAHLLEHAAERRVIVLHDGVLMMLEPQRFDRAPLERRSTDAGVHLPDAQVARPRGRQRPVHAALALAVLPGGRLPSHGSPPVAAGSGSPRPRRRALWPPAAAWSGAATRRSSRAPCCGGWSSRGSS